MLSKLINLKSTHRCTVGAGSAGGVDGVAVLREGADAGAAVEGEEHAAGGGHADVLAVDHVGGDVARQRGALASPCSPTSKRIMHLGYEMDEGRSIHYVRTRGFGPKAVIAINLSQYGSRMCEFVNKGRRGSRILKSLRM